MAEDRYISKEQVEHVAWLAKLKLTDEEKKRYTRQFNRILEYFKRLNELDTEGVPPTYNVMRLVNVFREDKVKSSLSIEDAIKNSAKRRDRHFEAPRIL